MSTNLHAIADIACPLHLRMLWASTFANTCHLPWVNYSWLASVVPLAALKPVAWSAVMDSDELAALSGRARKRGRKPKAQDIALVRPLLQL